MVDQLVLSNASRLFSTKYIGIYIRAHCSRVESKYLMTLFERCLQAALHRAVQYVRYNRDLVHTSVVDAQIINVVRRKCCPLIRTV